MGWFYEVSVAGEILDEDSEDKLISNGEVIVQGKNSKRDYEGFYMDHGEAFRYPSLQRLMGETEGEPDDVRLIADYGDINGDGGFIYFVPVFRDGEWWLKTVEDKPYNRASYGTERSES